VSCGESQKFAHAFVDGELAGGDRDAYQRHVSDCEECARVCRLEARFKAAVRALLPRPPVPVALRARLTAALDAERPPARRWPWTAYPRLVPAVAAGLALTALMVTVRGRSRVLEQAQRIYQTDMPMDVLGPDCASVASWFRGRVDFPVHAPALAGAATCQGGRLMNVGERPAAYLVYQAPGGHRVSFLVFEPRDERLEARRRRAVNGRDVYFENGPGLSTAVYRDRGLGYVVTSDLDEDSLYRLVTTSFR